MAQGSHPSKSIARGPKTAAGGYDPAQPSVGAPIGARSGLADTLDGTPLGDAPQLREGGADADGPTGRYAIATATRRRNGPGAGRHGARARWTGAPCRCSWTTASQLSRP